MNKRWGNIKSEKKADDFRWIYFVLSLLSLFLSSCFFVPEQPIEDDFHPGIIVTAAASNNSPSISNIANINSEIGSRITGVSFTVDESDNISSEEDDQTLTVTASSSNQSLIPDANIIVNYTDNGAGDASNVVALIDLYPAKNEVGVSVITLTVKETGNPLKLATTTFTVTVSNPLTTIPNLIFWLKADAAAYKDLAGTTLAADGDDVVRWDDLSTAGIITYVSQVNTASAPNFNLQASMLNNRPSILFNDANSDFLNREIPLFTTSPVSAFFVMASDNINSTGCVFCVSRKTGNGDYYGAFLVGAEGGDPFRYRVEGSGGTQTLDDTGPGFNNNEALIMSIREETSSNRSLYRNGKYVTSNLVDNTPNLLARTAIGRLGRNGPVAYFSGHIAEIIVFNRTLSISEQHKIESYLGVKYGIQTIPSNNQKLWLKADQGVTSDACAGTNATNGQTVACWDDQSGNNNDASTIIGAPTFTASLSDGTPNYVSLNGSSYLEVGAAATWAFLNSGKAHTEFLVFKTTSTNPATTFSLLDTKADATDNLGFNLSYDDTSNDQISVLIAEGATTSTISHNTADGAVTAGSWNIVTHELTTASTSHLITTGSLASSVSTGSAFNGASPAAALAIGANATAGTNSIIGDLGEVIVYDASLTHTDRQRTEMYLSEKYNITYPSHPVLNQPGLKYWLKSDSGVDINRDKSAHFTAANTESLTTPDHPDLNTGDIDFTIAGWMYLDNKNNYYMLATKIKAGLADSEYYVGYHIATNRFVFLTTDGVATSPSVGSISLSNIDTKRWYFIKAWHDSVGDTINISVNDGATNSTPVVGGVGTGGLRNQPFAIGSYSNGTSYNMDGRIARVGFWKKVLTASETTHLYNQGSGRKFADLDASLSNSDLKAYWDLDEASGAVRVNDANPGTNDLADNNTVDQSPGPDRTVFQISDQSPFVNTASQATAINQPLSIIDGGAGAGNYPVIRFDGTNDYVNSRTGYTTWGNSYTVVAKIKSTDTTTSILAVSPILGWWNGVSAGGTGQAFGLDAGKISFNVSENNAGGACVDDAATVSGSFVADGNAHWVAVSVNQTTNFVRLYVDGVYDTQVDISSIDVTGCGIGELEYIGSTVGWPNRYLNFDLMQLIVYNRVLSDTEIATLKGH